MIQSRYPADFRLFPTKQSGSAGCRQVIPPPPSLSPVTHRDRPCASFKTRLGKMYNGTGISARWTDLEQRHFSPNPPILPGSKSVLVKVWVALRHPDVGHRPAKPGERLLITIEKQALLYIIICNFPFSYIWCYIIAIFKIILLTCPIINDISANIFICT